MTTNTTAPAALPVVDDAIKALTPKGRDTMTAVGLGQLSFFDEGIVEGSGIWGYCMTQELGHKSSGVINQLVKLQLFTATDNEDGVWFALTQLGADVARELAAGSDAEQAAAAQSEPVVEPKPAKKAKSSKAKSEPAAEKKTTTNPGQYVRHEKKSRATGLVVRVLDLSQSSVGNIQIPDSGEKWATECMSHAVVAFHKSHRAAVYATWTPGEWCRKCATVVRKREKDAAAK